VELCLHSTMRLQGVYTAILPLPVLSKVLNYQQRRKGKSRLKPGNACYFSVQNLLSSSLLSYNIKIKIQRTIILCVVCMDVKLCR
jgi:hypothetical protein